MLFMRVRFLRAGLCVVVVVGVALVVGSAACTAPSHATAGAGGHDGGVTTTDAASSTAASSTGTGSSTAMATSSSSGNLQGCLDCANTQILGPTASCTTFTDACEALPECLNIGQCHAQCGYGPMCKQQCDAAHPTGAQAYANLVSCAVCKMCITVCAGQQVAIDYCP
jgi:hypothetical protein